MLHSLYLHFSVSNCSAHFSGQLPTLSPKRKRRYAPQRRSPKARQRTKRLEQPVHVLPAVWRPEAKSAPPTQFQRQMREKKQGVPSKISQAAMIPRKCPAARQMALKVGKRPAARRGQPGGRVTPLSEKSHPAAQHRRQPLRDPRIASQRVSTGTTLFSVFF